MSSARPKPLSVWQKLRPPAAINYLVLVAAGLLVYATIMTGRGNDVGALVALLVAAAGILARWTGAPVLILLLTAYLMIDPGFLNLIGLVTRSPWTFPGTPPGFDPEDVLLAAGLLAYAIGHYRLTSMVHQGMPADPTVQRIANPADPPRYPAELAGPDDLPRALVVGAGCVILGQVTWVVLALVEKAGRPRESRFTDGSARFILVVWMTGLALLLVSAALVYLRGNRMTPAEAALVLRDEFFQENRRETDRLQRWRKWFKERVARRRRAGK